MSYQVIKTERRSPHLGAFVEGVDLTQPLEETAVAEIKAALLEYGDVSEALMWLHSIFKYDPDHRDAHASLADFYERRGDRETAAEHRKYLAD